MNQSMLDSNAARDIAIKESKRFDFEYREVILNEPIGEVGGKTVFRIVIKLSDSPERIQKAITESSHVQGIDYIRELIAQGKSICIKATNSEVISEEWLEIDFS